MFDEDLYIILYELELVEKQINRLNYNKQMREYYREHPDKRAASFKKWFSANPDYFRGYASENRELLREYRREYNKRRKNE